MNRLLLFLTFSELGLFPFAQGRGTTPGDSLSWELRKQAFIYNSSEACNDPGVAKPAFCNLLSETLCNPALYDSLVYLYTRYNQLSSVALAVAKVFHPVTQRTGSGKFFGITNKKASIFLLHE